MKKIPSYLFAALVVVIAAAAPSKPNIVYILADDMGIGDVRSYNEDCQFPTPHIDRMADEGMSFMDAHTNSSVCTPTRYGILTGRYCWRTDLKEGVLNGYSPPLIKGDRETIASFLKKEGYRTASIGKWHLGLGWVHSAAEGKKRIDQSEVDHTKPLLQGPLDIGFDYFFRAQGSSFYYMENREVVGDLRLLSPEEFPEQARSFKGKPKYVAEGVRQEERISAVSEKTCAWIRKNAEQPFFVYMPLPAPHSPITPSEWFEGKSGLSAYGDFVMETDWAVGEVLRTLDELELAENTLVIFTTDNGCSPTALMKELQEKGHYPSGVYRGLKGTTWEGGHRVPFVVRWPGQVEEGSVNDQLICTTDFMATLAEMFGKELPDNVGEDSVSFLPALKGKDIPNGTSRMVVHHSDNGVFAVRRGKWKLMLDSVGGSERRNPKDQPVVNSSELLLFDMESDEVESTNVAMKYPEVVESLKQELAEMIKMGRSTPGERQATDVEKLGSGWKQLDPIRGYLN